MSAHLAVGIGCSSRATREDVLALLALHLPTIPSGTVLATLDQRKGTMEPVASSLGLDLLLFPASILAQVSGATVRSQKALQATGTSSVAEAAALASLGPQARLILTRQTGHLCTCAIAEVS